MARFYGELRGNRQTVTRVGTEKSGIVAHVRGWKRGIAVVGASNAFGDDVFHVFITGGSDHPKDWKWMGMTLSAIPFTPDAKPKVDAQVEDLLKELTG